VEVFKLFGTISLNKDQALKDLKDTVNEAEKQSGKLQQGFEKAGKSAEKWLKRGATVAVAGLTAAMVGGVKAAADFETSMTELAKVTDPETAGSVAANIRQMSKDMPIAHEALMGIAADAGRLGVEGVDNILAFTETVAQISVATDIMAEEAGTDFARLLKLLGEDIEQVDELGSAINELSNNMATSSSEIVDGMLRSSAALKGLNLGTDEVVALNAAMNEVSESSMRAGTALRTVAEKLKNPEKMKELANVLGITVEEFRNLRDEDPMTLFKELALAMNEGGTKAEELTGILGESASRLQALGTNWEGVEEAVRMANAEFENATSLQNEYNVASDTFSNRVQTLKNNFHDIMIDVGDALMPTLDEFVSWMRSNTPEISELLTGMAEGLAKTFGWILEHKEGLSTALTVIGTGIAALGLASLLAHLNPISLAIGAVSAAIAALIVYWDDVVGFFKDVGKAVGGAWEKVKGWFGFGKSAGEEIAAGLRASKEDITSAFDEILTVEDLKKKGRDLGGAFAESFGQAAGREAGTGITAGTLTGESNMLGSTVGGSAGIPDLVLPEDETLTAWERFWQCLKDGTADLSESLAEMWENTRDAIGNAIADITLGTIRGMMAQADAHKEAKEQIREDTTTTLEEEKKALDESLEALQSNLDTGLISQNDYTAQRIALIDEFDAREKELMEQQESRLAEEEELYKKQKKSIWEILKDSVRDVLKAIKEELLLKAAAALAEAIAMTIGLNPLAGPKYGEAAAYAAGAAGLQIAGFEHGGVFDRPTVLPPQLIAEGGVAEAFIPLSPDVLGNIGRGIAANMPQSVGGEIVNQFYLDNVKMDSSARVNELAEQLYSLQRSRSRGAEGRRM